MTTRKLQLNNKSNDYSSSLIEREDNMNTIHINDVIRPKTKAEFHQNLKRYFVTNNNYKDLTIVRYNSEKIKKMRRMLSEKLIQKKMSKLSYKDMLEQNFLIFVDIPINQIDDFSDIYSLTNSGFCGDGRAPYILLGSHYSKLIDLVENGQNSFEEVKMIAIDGGNPIVEDPDFMFSKDYIPVQFKNRKLMWKLLGNFINYDCSDEGKGHRIDMDRFLNLYHSCPIHSPFRVKNNRPNESSPLQVRTLYEMFKANKGQSYIDNETKFEDKNIKLVKMSEIKTSPEFENGEWNRKVVFI